MAREPILIIEMIVLSIINRIQTTGPILWILSKVLVPFQIRTEASEVSIELKSDLVGLEC